MNLRTSPPIVINIEDIDQQIKVYYQVIEEELSVRKTEELVRQMQVDKLKDPSKATKKKQLNQDFEELSGHLSKVFNSEVVFRINNKGKGKIVIPFEDSDDMERILGLLDRLNS